MEEEKKSNKGFLVIFILIIIAIGGYFGYTYFFSDNLKIVSSDKIYSNRSNMYIINSKDNYTYKYSVSDDNIASFKSETLTGPNPSNSLIIKQKGTINTFVQVYDNGKLIKSLNKRITVCGNLEEELNIKSNYNIKVGEEITIIPDNNDKCYEGLSITSNDNNIVEVIRNTKILGKNKGTATLTMVNESNLINFNVTVGNSSSHVDNKEVKVTGISINEKSISLNINQKHQLKPNVLPNNATNKNVTYTSSNSLIAKVNSSGLVEGVNIGECDITIKTQEGNYETKVHVKVNNDKINVQSISVDKKDITIKVGESVTIKETINPSNATNKNVTWTSNNNSVATVSNGVVKGLKEGKSIITVKSDDSGMSASTNVTVISNGNGASTTGVAGILVSPTNAILQVGESIKLGITIIPYDAKNQKVTWTSNNTSVVTVTSDGTITAKKEGNAIITAKSDDGGKTSTSNITVIKKSGPVDTSVSVTGISLNKTSASINVGTTITLTATISPSNATDKTVTWTSSNTNVATVSNGIVLGKTAGTAVITASSNNGKTATATITVTNTSTTVNVTSVSLNTTSASINVGGSVTLTATVSPSNATNKNVTWTSSNTNVATVSNGVVTGVAAGTAVITASSNNGKTATATITVTSSTPVSTANKLHSINIGQAANAILLESNGRYGMIDAGGNCSRITSYLSNVGVHNLDFIIISHMHYDHAQCVTSVMSMFPTSKVIFKKYNGYDKGNNWGYYNPIVTAAGSKAEYFSGSGSKTVTLGNMTLKLFNGQERLAGVQGQYSENANSIVVGVSTKVGSKTMLTYIAGDIQDANTGIEASVASTVTSSYGNKKFDVYVASHHGYRSCNTTAAIGSGSSKVQFKNAIVTNTFEWMCGTYCGKANGCPYDNPKATGVYNIYQNLVRNGGSKQIRFSGASTVVVDYTASGVNITGGQVLNCTSSTCGSAESTYNLIKQNSSICSRVMM